MQGTRLFRLSGSVANFGDTRTRCRAGMASRGHAHTLDGVPGLKVLSSFEFSTANGVSLSEDLSAAGT